MKYIRLLLLLILIYIILLGFIWYFTGYWLYPRGYQARFQTSKLLDDQGVFTKYNHKTIAVIPSWLNVQNMRLSVNHKQTYVGLSYAQRMLAIFPIKNRKITEGETLLKNLFKEHYESKLSKAWRSKGGNAWRDNDGDGIPNGLDIQLGMQKVIYNHASYLDQYVKIPYPNGDVSHLQGVCTDVLIRTFRNAGIDLQKLIYEDMKRAPQAYGFSKDKKIDRSIEHRRVRRLIIYFKRHYTQLPTKFDPTAKGKNAWLPGDILFMSLLPDQRRPRHVGLVSPYTLFSDHPMVTNNLAHFFNTADIDFLGQVPMMYRFRL